MKQRPHYSPLFILFIILLILLLAFGVATFLYGKRQHEREPWNRVPQVAYHQQTKVLKW